MSREVQGTHNEKSVFAAFDLVPSLLKIATKSLPTEIAFDGEELADVLLGKSQASRKKAICWRRPPDRPMWNHPTRGEERLPDLAIRDGDWKLLCTYSGEQIQLYDLANDRGETNNVAKLHPTVAADLTTKVLAWHQSLPADNGPAYTNVRAKKGKGDASR